MTLLKRRDKLTTFLLMTLFTASFNDLLRVPGTTLTLFRILMPIAVIFCMILNKHCHKYVLLSVIVGVINFVQSVFWTEMNVYGIEFKLTIFISSLYFYICIVSLLLVIDTIRLRNTDFEFVLLQFIKIVSLGYLLLLLLYVCFPEIALMLEDEGMLSNMNNIGACIAATLPVYIYETFKEENKRSFFFLITSFFLIVLLGRKLCLVGMLVSVVVMYAMIYTIRYEKYVKIGIFLMILVIINQFGYIVNLDSMFNKITAGLQHLLFMHEYAEIYDSESYRVTVFIEGGREILDTFFCGIGIGNAQRVIPAIIPLSNDMLRSDDGVAAVHNFIIEILLEFGFVALIAFVGVIIHTWNVIRINSYKYKYIYVGMFSGIWFWGLAPSGFYTLYHVYIIFMFTYFMNKKI
ncbi:MAG: O-antigen ligase family protein [Selenomonas ruminantium]|uniref:O-antigen ligase family protein n=2 Tax=Selenomonas ruminantium TaxID=971 RepID=A0A927ZZJ7_SELRU|nr:O-antigen ligase family protein [Selenomonas ruminantium]